MKKKGTPDSPAPAGPRLSQQLCFALYSTFNALSRVYAPLLEPHGLTYLQYLAMMVLWECDSLTVGALGERLFLDSGTLTPLLKKLEAKKLVTRKRDPGDERRVVIALTEAGRALEAAMAPIQEKILCKSSLSLEEAASLKSTLERLRAQFQGN